ncbi:hypothetical protein C3L33_18676, partial [Rhododendron williamsianum]
MPILSILIFLLFLRPSSIASQQSQFQEYPPNPHLFSENRVLRINPLNIGTSEPAVEVFFGPKPGEEGGEIIGIAVSTLSSSVFINVKNRGLFAYRLQGQLLWSTGPMLYQWGYRQGCRKDVKDCYFSSIPVIDQCEASLYISNTEGELYSLSVRSPRFKWVQDLSSFDKSFTITPGNNGRLYVTVAVKAILLALDVNTGTVLWQRNFGPLSTADCAPVIDSNGWVSIGSLNGFLYSFSPTGILKKFPKADAEDSVLQFSPLLDCSGYAVYISQTVMDGKISHTIGEYNYISALKPVKVVFTLLVPATGSVYWSESYPEIGNPLPCRSTRQKLASSCSQAEPKLVSIYTGNERAIPLFLLFETAVLIVLVIAVRFCCLFWRKKKLQGQDLGKFLEKRHSLQQQKKAFDRTITELEKKAAEEAMANEMLEKLGDLVKQKEGIERKLSTTYSLGRDRTNSKSKSLLPLSDGKTKSYSFQGSKKESVTIFHALSDTSSADSSSEKEMELSFFEDKESAVKAKGKGKAHSDVGSSSDDDENCEGNEGSASAGPKGFMNPLFVGNAFDGSKELKVVDEGEVRESMQSGDRSIIRRRSLSSTY